MKKLITAILILISVNSYAQTTNATNTKFSNGLAVPNGVAQKPTTGLTAGALSYVTGVGLYVYNGSSWALIDISGSSGVTSFNTRTGAVVPVIGDYSPFYVPLTRTITINGSTRDLSVDRVFNVGSVTSITPAYGLTPQTAITSSGTFRVDTAAVQTVLNFFPKGDTRYARTGATGTVTSVSSANSDIGVATGTTTPVLTLASGTGTGSLVRAVSPTFTGVPLAPTATAGTYTTQLATTAFVTAGISAIPSISFAAFGSTPNSNGGSIASGVITLHPASATMPGGVTTGTQTFAGSKTFGNLFVTDVLYVGDGTGQAYIRQNRANTGTTGYTSFETNFGSKWRVGLGAGSDNYIINNTSGTNAIEINQSTNAVTIGNLTNGLVKSTSGLLSNASTADLNSAGVVLTTTDQTIAGVKSFTSNTILSGTGSIKSVITRPSTSFNNTTELITGATSRWEYGTFSGSEAFVMKNNGTLGTNVFNIHPTTNDISIAANLTVGIGVSSSTLSVSGASTLTTGSISGVVTAPTATAGTNTTQLATTAFVTTADNLKANLASPTFTGTVNAAAVTLSGALTATTSTIGTATTGVKLTVREGLGTLPTFPTGTQLAVVNNASTTDISRLSIVGGATGYSILDFSDAASATQGTVTYNHSTDAMGFTTAGTNDRMTISSTGAVTALSFTPTSDSTAKKNIMPLGLVLDKVMLLAPKTFEWKVGGAKSIGLMAQDASKIFPVIVKTSESGKLGLSYDELAAIAIKAIQEQQVRLEALEAKNTALEARITALELR